MKYRFSVGDRVQRPVNVFSEQSRIRVGTVTLRYERLGTAHGDYPELYHVKWDEGDVGTGYLPHGLQPAELKESA